MKKSSLMRKLMVLMMTLAVVITYSVAPMNQSFAASAKKPAKVKSVKAVALSDSSTSIKVSWKKAKNAKKYQVYMAAKKKGKFKKIATTKEKNYIKAGLKDGKKYYFKVRAVNGKKKGAFSKVVSAKARYVAPAPAPAPAAKEVPATLGEAKIRRMTTTVNMDKYPKGKVVKVWIPVPKSDEYQTIYNVEFSADTATKAKITTESEHGNKMLYVMWDKDTDPADRVASLSFSAKRYDVRRDKVVEDPSAGIPADVKQYITEESAFVKVNAPVVQQYAKEATAGKTGTVEKARAIYDWVIKNLERIDNKEILKNASGEVNKFTVDGCGYGDTVAILTDLKEFGRAGGHCTDINSTFVALCRAAGIPAREMFGIRMNDDATGGQHCWAEFYVAGTGWVYADPGDVLKAVKTKTGMTIKEVEARKASDEIKAKAESLWAGVENNRVVLSVGRDITFNPAQSWGVCNTFGYPAAEVDGKRLDTFTNGKDFDYSIKSEADRTVFVDEAYVRSEVEKKGPNTVIAEVSWGPDAPEEMIPGAIHVNTDDIESNYLDTEGTSAVYELWDLRGFDSNYDILRNALAKKYGITKDTELICYGWDGCNSAPTRLAFAALMLGVKDVKVLDGGAEKWTTAGTSASAPKPADSFGTDVLAHPDWIISTPDLVAGAQSGSVIPVSIRSYDEFTGKSSGYAYIDKAGEPLGAVWGHDTDDGSYFIDGKTVGVDKINEYLKPYNVSTSDDLAFYCGTGWRATIPFLICYEAGIDNVCLWDDGWYVYSGAYLDPWNYGDATTPTTFTDDSYPVQIGDPAKGAVTVTTVGALEPKYNPLRGDITPVAASVTLVPGVPSALGFNILPPKGGILNSVTFTSSDENVATVDAEGKVTIAADAAAGARAKITATANATYGSTPDKEGKHKTASYEVVAGTYLDLSKDNWAVTGIKAAALDADDYLVDVRTTELFRAGHLAGSVSCPVSNPFTPEQKAAIKQAYDDANGKRVVIVCVSGNMLAKNAMQALSESEGVDMSKVTYLIGGANGVKDNWIVE